MTQVRRNSSSFSVALNQTPEVLSAQFEKRPRIIEIRQVIKHPRTLIEERIRVLNEGLGSLLRTFEPLHREVTIAKVISCKANDFRDTQPMREGHEDHQPVALAVRFGDLEQRSQLVQIEVLNCQKESKKETVLGIVS